ncbi:MAG: NAD(P)/FAD-dependent oxidoreductase [Patescibacteria group bacterium]
MKEKKAIIIGAGPGGLTTGWEFLKRTDIKPIVLEMSGDIGGISKTINYKGNRIDIGGHRFFSKSDRVMEWWKNILPIEKVPLDKTKITYHGQTRDIDVKESTADPKKTDKVMLIRNRLSRIFYLRKFFDYPVSLSKKTLTNLGVIRVMRIGFSYLRARIFPIKEEKSLEDFFINRFGRELYLTFFKDYTEKVWGIPCNQINPEWGAQRIKGLSIREVIKHAIKSKLPKKDIDIDQKNIETSLIERFLYPKFGPGQMWEEVADQIKKQGGEINMNENVIKINCKKNKVKSIVTKNSKTGKETLWDGDYFISTMPIIDLINDMGDYPDKRVIKVANKLMYRDFITVGLLMKKLKIKNDTKIKTINNIVPDNWIYIQEREVKIGRLQIFNNWSPYMVKDKKNTWIGLEYFCTKGDELWKMTDKEFIKFAISELVKIDIIEEKNVLDSTIIRVEKTYPVYAGGYERFDVIRKFTDSIENLFLIGRNGMHRYNNSDHSMLTGMMVVDNILAGIKTKDNIWDVNTEQEYHEEKTS